MSITQNAFKGYSFQDTIYCMFALLLDTDKNMNSIDAEYKKNDKNKNHNFDDMKVVHSNIEYYIQIKNYKNLTQNDIKIENGVAILGSVASVLRDGNNVIVLHYCELTNNDSLFGLHSYLLSGVHIISVSASFICEYFSRIYEDDIGRFSDIAFKFAKDRLARAEFYVIKDDLPPLNLFFKN